MSHLFFETNLEEKKSTPNYKLFLQNKIKRKEKKLLQSYTPCINSQSVKNKKNKKNIYFNKAIIPVFTASP